MIIHLTKYSENLELFRQRFEKLNGIVIIAKNMEETTSKIVEQITSYGGRTVYTSSLFEEFENGVKKALVDAGFVLIDSLQENPVEVMKNVDVGISAAVAAVAETGTLVEAAYDDVERLVSSLPRVHIVLVKSSTIVKTIYQLAELLKEHLKHRTAALTLISGPSRSGDIEQRLVVGIHGPHIVVAVVLEWL